MLSSTLSGRDIHGQLHWLHESPTAVNCPHDIAHCMQLTGYRSLHTYVQMVAIRSMLAMPDVTALKLETRIPGSLEAPYMSLDCTVQRCKEKGACMHAFAYRLKKLSSTHLHANWSQ